MPGLGMLARREMSVTTEGATWENSVDRLVAYLDCGGDDMNLHVQ